MSIPRRPSPPKHNWSSTSSPAKILADGIRKTGEEPKLKENLKTRGYNVDLCTSTADLNKLIKEEVDKYSCLTPEDLGWKSQ